ncbi:MAG: AmmeMemoRadiSam system protein A [Nitrosomonas sp.]|uniref:AmmeMemoRadiSam system protein A n=1 Tax=Nitrosomonas sp. TaxID=42353 RepID=UPI002735A1F3|nr:AmmeMemoRadiSam system protein A [Nitrosomonas sp.]MDP3663798.1 AmmeMemoRadiSam system protein A [Nitrosomonas sp.]MDZ4107207.1 AmmeMemoRadiSam system protein A [Nitrosomonas sp.]
MLLEKNEQGKILLQIARTAISRALRVFNVPATEVDENMAWLFRPGATFVTLTQWGELRGCIGSLQACDPLIEDVSNNAVSAALYDPRFSPLAADDLDTVSLEVSLLSELQPLGFTSEADALAQLRPDIDGIVFEYGPYRSTFLPQVWESLPQPQQFLARLKSKARLSEDFWAEDVKLSRYTVSKWCETDYSKEYVNG